MALENLLLGTLLRKSSNLRIGRNLKSHLFQICSPVGGMLKESARDNSEGTHGLKKFAMPTSFSFKKGQILRKGEKSKWERG